MMILMKKLNLLYLDLNLYNFDKSFVGSFFGDYCYWWYLSSVVIGFHPIGHGYFDFRQTYLGDVI